ncbi:10576_t:CDS:2, partial [Acaulospora morrowiae]
KILRSKPVNENEKANFLVSKGADIVCADYNKEDELVNALEGTDVLISTISLRCDIFNIQCNLLAAAKKVGVKRFIPSEFGMEHTPSTEILLKETGRFQKELEKSGLEYTFIYNGLFQEYLGWIGFDVKNKSVKFYVDGNTKLVSTSMADIGKYTVESLKIPEARNAHIRVAGAILTLDEYLQKFEEASGSKWEVVYDKEIPQTGAEKFKAMAMENAFFENIDNDKFSFSPRPVTEVIGDLVSNTK